MPHFTANNFIAGFGITDDINAADIGPLPRLGNQGQFHLLIFVLVDPWPGFYPGKGMTIAAKMPFHGINGCLHVFQLVGLSRLNPDQ